MKTVCKKLLVVMLVAMMLVSAIPFQALAADGDTTAKFGGFTKIIIKDEKSNLVEDSWVQDIEKGGPEHKTLDEILKHFPETENWACKYKIAAYHASETTDLEGNGVDAEYKQNPKENTLVKSFTGRTVTISLKTIEVKDPTEESKDPTQESKDPTQESKDPTPTGKTVELIVNGKKYGEAQFDENDKLVKAPADPSLDGYKFEGWYSKENGEGYPMESNMGGKVIYDKYYAYLVESSDDGRCTLEVVAVYQVNGVEKGKRQTVYSESFPKGTKDALNILMKAEDSIWAQIVKKAPSNFVEDKFTWKPRKFYNQTLTTELTDQTLTLNGDRTVYVKVNSTVEAPVSLEIHTKISSTANRTVWMTGYLAGDQVTLKEAIAVVKNYYKVSDKNVKMYTDAQWKDLVENDNNAKTVEQVDITSNTKTTKIHVYLTNATATNGSSGNSGNADTTNPKTGDSIFVAVTVMGLSASALAAAYVFSKKRMSL